MTLCIVWRDRDNINFCSDSRLSFGASASDVGIKIVRIPIKIYGPYDCSGSRDLIIDIELGFCFAGSAVGAIMTKDALVELVSNLQAVPGYQDISMNGIADFLKRGFEAISREVSSALWENGATKIVFAGYCGEHNCLRAFSMERDRQNNFTFSEILQTTGSSEIFGTGAKAAKAMKSQYPMSDREAVQILQSIIDDESIETVGGNIQFGRLSGTKFHLYGVAKLGDDAVHYWRGPLDLNGPVFNQAEGLIPNFPLINMISE